jgi:outer membrane lipoprotein-sorting protein
MLATGMRPKNWRNEAPEQMKAMDAHLQDMRRPVTRRLVFGGRQSPTGAVAVEYPYLSRWDRHGRKGQLCAVLARGTMNSCLLKFEDGYTMVTSRNALKRVGVPVGGGAHLGS